MTHWEHLEEVLFEHDMLGSKFTSRDLAAQLSISPNKASALVRSYLDAQRRRDSRTLYVLHREPGTRTSRAVWSVGQRARDVTLVGATLEDDIRRRVLRAVRPDIMRIAVLNPRAGRRAGRVIESLVDGVLVTLTNVIAGVTDVDHQD